MISCITLTQTGGPFPGRTAESCEPSQPGTPFQAEMKPFGGQDGSPFLFRCPFGR